MTRNPKSLEPDAWKRWLRDGWRLFDRTWSGWTLAWWLLSLGVMYVASRVPNLLIVGLLAFASAAAFGAHIAVFDVLASGKRGMGPWLSAVSADLESTGRIYARTGVYRAAMSIACVVVVALVAWGLLSAASSGVDPTPKPAPEQSFWKSWVVWSWLWMIPAGWQKGGALGWGHWLMRREGASLETTESLTRLAIGLNARSYGFAVGTLLLGAIVLMFVFPPLLPVWDVYAAAVCWCAWDDIFGEGAGLKELEKKASTVSSSTLAGA